MHVQHDTCTVFADVILLRKSSLVRDLVISTATLIKYSFGCEQLMLLMPINHKFWETPWKSLLYFIYYSGFKRGVLIQSFPVLINWLSKQCHGTIQTRN